MSAVIPSVAIRPILALVLSILAASCAPAPAAGPTHEQAKAATPAGCAASGGTMERRGMLQSPMCVVPFKDAGKACTGKADCSGLCLSGGGAQTSAGEPVVGKCQAENMRFGCFAEVEAGRLSTPVLCVD